ncbi:MULTISPECIES: hypothetical protein [unclassified Dietzia]|uniref:hypothetical protein n=1 Tax=unclassified Dietzia TaxID=2617939 RepID=UPI0012E7BEC6|nr:MULTISPECIES: hypothetical protein [unclassified Dietzia]QGW24270.1 hypothetical protein GJR88_01900 [Dietzia sp. DQ12-45-1b]
MATPVIPQVRSVDHPDCPVEAWYEPSTPDYPDAPLPAMVALHVGYPGKDHDDPVFIPASIAREVAQAILDSLPE